MKLFKILFSISIIVFSVAVIFYYFQIKNTIKQNLEYTAVADFSSEVSAADGAPVTSTINLPILIYHDIRPLTVADLFRDKTYIVTPKIFDQQMRYLSEHDFTAVTIHQLLDHLLGLSSAHWPAKPVVITLDDGYSDQYTYALPILKKYNFLATFYIYVGEIGRGSNFLAWPEVKKIADAGMEIGSHTISHPNLIKINDLTVLSDELIKSKQILEEKLSAKIYSFAYPYGTYNESVAKAVADAGYLSARTVANRRIITVDKIFTLPGFIILNNLSRFSKIVGQ